ncbi:M28 family peptidase [[Eubacterium] cellulosolvens]
MNRKSLFAIVIVVIIIGAVAATVAVSDIFREEEKLVIIDFDCSVARGHVEQLVANGPRMSGSEEELLGAQYIISKYEEAGLENCHIEKFSVNMFEVIQVEVSLVQYGPMMRVPNPLVSPTVFTHTVDFVLQGYSGNYAWSDFRDDLEIEVIGNGSDPEAYNAASGMACFIEYEEDGPGNPEIYRNAYAAGASAIVLQNLRNGEEINYPPFFKTNQAYEDWGGTYPEIPFFMVSKDVGQTIKQHVTDSKLRINFEVEKGPMDICVTVGEIPGSKKSDELFIIGGHHDTCYNTLGVVDNTVGPAIICEMAAQIAKYKPKYTIRFCTFGGEEEGLFGSTAYFAAHENELVKNVKMYSNFDMSHADITRVNRFTVTTSVNSSIGTMEKIIDKIVAKTPELERYSISIRYDDGKWSGSDQWPFASHDIDVTNAWGGGCYEYHTYLDDLSHLNEESLQIGGRIVGSYILNEAL